MRRIGIPTYVHEKQTKEGPMRLTFNRLLALAAIAATGLMAGCSTDSPGPTGNPKPGNGGLSIVLSTTNSTPEAGSCTVIQAFATQNGTARSHLRSIPRNSH